MEIYRVSFIGHKEIEDYFFIENQLYYVVSELVRSKEYIEFFVGHNGEFDILVASVIKRVKREIRNHNSSLILVIPYPVAEMKSYENYYDEVIYPMELHKIHYKAAIKKRNEWFVKNSDLLIAYVIRDYGGAAYCLKKAIDLGIEILHIDRASVEWNGW